MLERLISEYGSAVVSVMEWSIGKPSRAMAFAYILTTVNAIATSLSKKQLSPMEYIERMFAYGAFMMLGNIIDLLAVDAMFQWEGSTQFLICLYIVGREATLFKRYLTDRFGIDVPILSQRLEQLAPSSEEDPELLNARMTRLKREIEELEQEKEENPTEEELA